MTEIHHHAPPGTVNPGAIMSLPGPGYVVYYVDGATGNDAYDGLAAVVGGEHGPKATINGALALVPCIRRKDYFIKIADGTYSEILRIDGSGNITLIGGATVQQTGTVTAFNDVDITLNPCGFYQIDINWAGGFALTDLVDDEKWLRVNWGDGTYQLFNIQSVLAPDRVEVVPYKRNGKVAADYIGKTIELVIPSVAIQNPMTVTKGPVVIIATSAIAKGRYDDTDAASITHGFNAFGIMFKRQDNGVAYPVLQYEGASSTTGFAFCTVDGKMGNAIIVRYCDHINMLSTVHYGLNGPLSVSTYIGLANYMVGADYYGPGIVVKSPDAYNSISVEMETTCRIYHLGVWKGRVHFHYGSTVSQFLIEGTVYNGTDHCVEATTSRICSMNINLYRFGGIYLQRCTLDAAWGYPGMEFRACTEAAIELDKCIAVIGDSYVISIASVYAGSTIKITDSIVHDALAGLLQITSMPAGQRAVEITRSTFHRIGETRFPVQDYGASPASGIVVADQESHVVFEGAVTGKNTHANAAADDPLVLRHGSKADVSQTAGYALQDNAGAETLYLGHLGNGIAVPAAGVTKNDFTPAANPDGTEELCRISAV